MDSKMVFSSSFREAKLYLEAELPVGATLVGRHHVAVGCQLSINRQLAEPEKLANTAAGAVRYDAVFAVDLPLHFRRYIAHFSGVSTGANILSCNIKRVAGSHVRVGKNRRRFLGEQDPGEKQQ